MISDYRSKLLILVKEFYQSAIKIKGIYRIALTGSLTTDKKKPKDADMLVTISDDMDLIHLAKIGRRLQGKACSISSGADIFLTNRELQYIGRICEWNDCRPGIRIRCDALNCGKRKYLHDDLNTVNLSKEITTNPPLILFPEVKRNSKIPIDVEEELIMYMKKEFVPNDFVIPLEYKTEHYRLEVLTPKVGEMDYEAVMTSKERLRSVFGKSTQWPTDEMTLEENVADLRRHENEFKERKAFAYTVLDLSGKRCIGCVYIKPARKTKYDCEVYLWVRESELKLDEDLYKNIKSWVINKWPFTNIAFPWKGNYLGRMGKV